MGFDSSDELIRYFFFHVDPFALITISRSHYSGEMTPFDHSPLVIFLGRKATIPF